jgi:hypothetical protein
MMRHAEVRENMADLLNELPNFIQDCEDYVALYKGQNMLKLRVHEFYIELLSALEGIVKWYTQSSARTCSLSASN